jgi:hypothetical protein
MKLSIMVLNASVFTGRFGKSMIANAVSKAFVAWKVRVAIRVKWTLEVALVDRCRCWWFHRGLDWYSDRGLDWYSDGGLDWSNGGLDWYSDRCLDWYSDGGLDWYSDRGLDWYSDRGLDWYSNRGIDRCRKKDWHKKWRENRCWLLVYRCWNRLLVHRCRGERKPVPGEHKPVPGEHKLVPGAHRQVLGGRSPVLVTVPVD